VLETELQAAENGSVKSNWKKVFKFIELKNI